MTARTRTILAWPVVCVAVTLASCRGVARFPDLPQPDFYFNTFICSWGGTETPEFRRFLEVVRPEIVQVGFYGPMFHGYADDAKSTGYPMQLPVCGQREALAAQTRVNRMIHALGLKVVGHFQMVNVIANLERRDGFLDFYENHWPEDMLGPRPCADVRELLQRNADGSVITRQHYVDYVGLCPNSPHARRMLKAMLKVAVEAGVDGIVMNYNYMWSCACPYCQESFKQYLAGRYGPAELDARFGIKDLASHKFPRIPCEIPGCPDPKTATPLDWEAMRWGAIAFKQAFDEVLLDYGRSLKPDLIIATWDHIGDVGVSEERMFLPVELWGRGENYFWYSGGYGPTNLAEHKPGDGWLDCLYVREYGGGKPFMLGKYEAVRMRNSIAEGMATGGAGMGLYFNFSDPAGYEVGCRYLRFLHEHSDLYCDAEPCAEVGLVFPRQAVHAGHPEAADAFREIGRALAEAHVLFDVIADERLTAERVGRYGAVIVPSGGTLTDGQRAMLNAWAAGGRVLLLDGKGVNAEKVCEMTGLSQIVAPWTVRVSAFQKPGRIILHLVNYNRDEKAAEKLQGPAAECPVPAENVTVRLNIPVGTRVRRVRLLSPDEAEPRELSWNVTGQTLQFSVPKVIVYGIVEIRF